MLCEPPGRSPQGRKRSGLLDMTDNTTPIESTSLMSFDDISSQYDTLLPLYSVRTNNVLQALADNYLDKRSFLEGFVKLSRREIESLKNCGAKTAEEILAIQRLLNPNQEWQQSEDDELGFKTLPSNVDSLLPVVMSWLGEMSVRAKNGLTNFFEENHNSLTEAYAVFANPKFKPTVIKNIGRTSASEIKAMLDRIRDYLESFPDEQAVVNGVASFYARTYDDLHIPVEAQDGIRNLESSLGHFPLFAAINAYLEGLEGEERTIIDGCILIHEGQSLQDRDEIATLLNLSSERVRQKRRVLIETLSAYFASYRTLGFVDKCPYHYQMQRVNVDINASEGTDFNLHFVNWVLASVFDEVAIFGDVTKTLTGYYDKHFFVCLAPANLCQYIDFNAFIEDVDKRLSEKRVDEEKINLRSLIDLHLKAQYCEEQMPAIETACRSILYLHYPVEVDFGQVIFKPNARKNYPIIAEDILRAAGHPLTLEEIYEEFVYQYPERYTEMESFRGSIQKNTNIIPIGRTSTYTLAEWEGDTIRGGSIRKIIVDYLRSLCPTIASISEITEHVCHFRPTTDEYNILSNLSLERTGLFTFFFREGVRYIGLSENTYPVEFFPYSGDARNAFSMSIGYPKLVAFITENGHFPFTIGEDDERQLSSFWRRQQHYYNAGELTASGLAYHTMILSKYGHLQMDKKEYDWRKKYELLRCAFVEGELSTLDLEEQSIMSKLLSDMIHDYKYYGDSMPEWKKGMIKELLDNITETNNVQNNLG